jgi:hypothetical protein
LSTDDLAPTVIYSPHAEDFQHSQLFNELLRGDLHYHATVVIDECAAKERASIWGVLKGKRHIRLVTIDHGPEYSRDDQMLVIDCPRLSEEQIMAIIYLWIDYWKNYGRGFDFQAFFDELPPPLQLWFLQQFIYAHASPVACKVVRNILSSAGPFSQHTFLMSQAGTRFLNYLAEAEPSAMLAVIERTFGTWPLEELKNWQTGRQDIVWALEKIAVWREYFLRAAHVLVKLTLVMRAPLIAELCVCQFGKVVDHHI